MFFAHRRLGRRELSEYQHNRVQSRGAHAAPQGQGPVRPVSVSQGRRKPKRSGGVWRVVFIISLIVFVCAAGALAFIGYGYWHGQQNNKQLEQIGFNAPDAAALQRMDLASFTVDWDALRAINPDVVGWIYVPGTTVNFPIVHGTDDKHYLKTDFYGQTSWVSFGSIFLSAANAADFSDANNIVYGHHMNDGSMFSPFADFGDADTFNGHRTVYVFTPTANYQLTTFSIVHCAADDPLAQTAFASEQERQAYVQDKVDRSVVTVAGLPSAADMKHTFAFSTCDNLASNGRWVLFAYESGSTAAASSVVADDSNISPEDVAAVSEAAKETAA